MRKLYIAIGLLVVFLAAVLMDWNIRQESAQQARASSKIQSRDDDILELEIGYPGGREPPGIMTDPSGSHASSPPSRGISSGSRNVPGLDDPAPQRNSRVDEPEAGYTFYEVKEGDTLSEISLKVLGTSKRVKDIMELNGITDPKKILPGTRLKIPAR